MKRKKKKKKKESMMLACDLMDKTVSITLP